MVVTNLNSVAIQVADAPYKAQQRLLERDVQLRRRGEGGEGAEQPSVAEGALGGGGKSLSGREKTRMASNAHGARRAEGGARRAQLAEARREDPVKYKV